LKGMEENVAYCCCQICLNVLDHLSVSMSNCSISQGGLHLVVDLRPAVLTTTKTFPTSTQEHDPDMYCTVWLYKR
jgi:hypothetical protein